MARFTGFFVACAAIAGVAFTPAAATTLTFENITNNGSPDASGQIEVDVTDNGNGALVSIAVTSAGMNPNINITEIYFDDDAGVFTTPISIHSTTGSVNFNQIGSANPPDLPGGNSIMPVFDVTSGLLADSAPGMGNGVGVGDELVLLLLYSGGMDFNDVVDALTSGMLRIGFHIRSLANGSDSYINKPPSEVPIPGAIWLMGAGLAGLGFASRKKKTA